MKKIVHRVYLVWNYEKEIQWLNEMSRQGWQLVRYTPFRYEFERGEPGRYQYQLQLLDKLPPEPEYEAFLEGAGIQIVGRYLRWVYLRRENDGTPFEMFSDLDSLIRHIDGVLAICAVVFFCNLLPLFSLLASPTLIPLSLVNLALALFVGVGSLRLLAKRRALAEKRSMQE